VKRKVMVFVVACLLALLTAAPAFAAHNKHSQAGLPVPGTGPGNSGAAHDCRAPLVPLVFKNHGQCVSFFAHGGTLDQLPIPTT
jgi:hypothetical protein